MTKIKKITLKKIISDEMMKNHEGDYFNEDHYTHIVDENMDVFKENGEPLLKLRKNVIPQEMYKDVADSYRKVSQKKHDNRGPSSGPLDWDKMPNYVGEWVGAGKFRTHYTQAKGGKESKHNISNLSPSNIIGYWEKKDRNKPDGPPCRLTAFSEKERDKWEKTIPFLQIVDKQFKALLPERHKKQLDRANISKGYAIDGTSFSTVTVNYSWRTACHRDKGDFEDGFGNLVICEDYQNPNTYKGCYLGFPQYGVCVNVRQGDFLAMDVHEWHCNTEFKEEGSPVSIMKFADKDFKNSWHFNRLAIVCYLRKNMIKCNDIKKKDE